MTVRNEQLATVQTAIAESIKSALIDVHTALPGIITSFDTSTQTATIALGIKRITQGGVEIDIPPVTRAPVVFTRGGDYVITVPVTAGDECLVVFSEREITQWKNFGSVQAPRDRRRHAYTDGICIPGLSSAGNAIQNFSMTDLEIRSKDGTRVITISDDMITIAVDNTKMTLSNSGVIIDGNLSVNGTIESAGTVTAPEAKINNITFSTHVHISADAGDPTSGPQN